jgi:hypothetical protein
MFIKIQSIQGDKAENKALHFHTKVRIGGSDTRWIEFYIPRPLHLFHMPMQLIPVLMDKQMDNLVEAYQQSRSTQHHFRGERRVAIN